MASIAYLSEGDKSLPKERIEIFGGGKSFLIDDFRKGKGAQDKGQRNTDQTDLCRGTRGRTSADRFELN